MSTDTPTAERDVEGRVRALAHSLPPSDFGSTRAIQAVTAFVEEETRRLRAELEQARGALLYAKICMEAQQEISQPELDGFAYPDSPLGRVRAALSSSPGESAALSASPSPEDNP